MANPSFKMASWAKKKVLAILNMVEAPKRKNYL
jgi:hypothetical protein